MIKIRIAVDLDGTLFPTYEVIENNFRDFFGKEVDWRALGNDEKYKSTEEGKWLKRIFKNKSLCKYLTVSPELRNFLIEAEIMGHNIIYWTARLKSLENVTICSLWKNRLPYGKLYFVSRKNRIEEKSKLAKAREIDLAIEDERCIVKEIEKICKVILIKNGKIISKRGDWKDKGDYSWNSLKEEISREGEFF